MVEAIGLINTGEILGRWRGNTVPIYRFSDPEMSGTHIDPQILDKSKAWVRLLPQNLPRLVDEVLLEEREAEETFYNYWQRRLVKFFSSRVPDEADDLTQDATLRIRNALPAFENNGGGTFSRNLHAYCFAIARYTFYDYLNNRRIQPRTRELTGREYGHSGEVSNEGNLEQTGRSANWDIFWERVEQILPERQWQTVNQMRLGYGNVVIMKNLGVGGTVFRREAHNAKQTIDNQLLAPAGLKAINVPEFSVISTDVLKEAARRGKIDAIKILGRWYTTDTAFKTFLWQREHSSQVGDYIYPVFERVSQTRVDQVRTLVAQGLTISEIAVNIQRHPSLVKRTLAQMRREGEVIKVKRPPQERGKVDYTAFDEEVKILRQSGMENVDIAFFLEVSLGPVTRSIDRLSEKGELSLRKPFGRAVPKDTKPNPTPPDLARRTKNEELLIRIDNFITQHKEPYSIADAMRIVNRAKSARPPAHLRPLIRAILLEDGITTNFHPQITQGTLRKICLAVGEPNPKISEASRRYWQEKGLEEKPRLDEGEREVLRARKWQATNTPLPEEIERVQAIIDEALKDNKKDPQSQFVTKVRTFFLNSPREQYLLSDLFEAIGKTRNSSEDLRKRVTAGVAELGIQRVWKTAPLLVPLRLAIVACLETTPKDIKIIP